MRATVSKEEREVKAKAAETQALADEAKADLDQALPALNAAVDSLNALNKQDIVEIKSMLKPPPLVQMTMEVCNLVLMHAEDDAVITKNLFDLRSDSLEKITCMLYIEGRLQT